jgi:16S rRNA (cytosine967-C5)-methyltransferase
MARSQAAILAAGAGAVRSGGALVYSTCTISATENEHVIAAFLDAHPDFALDDLAAELPAFALSSSGDEQGRRGGHSPAATGSSSAPPAPSRGGLVLTLPHRDRTAGFFIARLRRS